MTQKMTTICKMLISMSIMSIMSMMMRGLYWMLSTDIR